MRRGRYKWAFIYFFVAEMFFGNCWPLTGEHLGKEIRLAKDTKHVGMYAACRRKKRNRLDISLYNAGAGC